MGKGGVYSDFTFGESIGVVILIACAFFYIEIRNYKRPRSFEFTLEEQHVVDSFSESIQKQKEIANVSELHFGFDPNTISSDSLVLLGLKKYKADRLVRFRESGFRFRKKEDLYRVYGLDSIWIASVLPYVHLKQENGSFSEKYRKPIRPDPVKLDLNKSDSAALIRARGIGPVTAHRIISYRKLLGGYHSVSQLREIYGMDSARYEKISTYFFIDSKSKTEKLDLMNDDVSKLGSHPYLSYDLARAIVTFRKQHPDVQLNGPGMLQIVRLDSSVFRKILPYVKIRADQGL